MGNFKWVDEMREIKFRAWFIETGLVKNEPCMCYDYTGWTIFELVGFGDNPAFKIIPMQFTGLQDVTGRDVYESDIVDIYGNFFIVIFDQRECGFGLKNKNGVQSLTYRITENMPVKIVGNIYENPELIEASK